MTLLSSVARQPRLLSLALACFLAPTGLSCAQTGAIPPAPVATHQAVQETKPRALWVWNGGVITQAEQQKQLFEFCRAKNIQILYLHLGDFLSDKKREDSDPKHVTAQALGDFLEAAHALNLRVEALDGDPSFSRTDKHDDALKRLQNAIAYNRAASDARKLDGFQWDTEPYVLKEFKDPAQHKTVLAEYLDGVKKSRDLVQAAGDIARPGGFWLGFALPFWMDGEKQALEWNGTTRPATFHVMEMLSTLPHAYIAFMAYRDKAGGDGGTIAVVRDEIDYAAQHTPSVQVVVGQETGAVKGDPPSITFYEEGEGALETALAQVNDTYASSPVYGGVAIHHLDSYRDLIARLPQQSASAAIGTATLTLAGPVEGAEVAISTEVSGKATGAAQVQVSVMPEGDIWYDSAPVAVGAGGDWSTQVRVGNDKTPTGRKFKIRARLLNTDGTVLQEKLINVVRR